MDGSLPAETVSLARWPRRSASVAQLSPHHPQVARAEERLPEVTETVRSGRARVGVYRANEVRPVHRDMGIGRMVGHPLVGVTFQ
jgi:hypothetical protein